MNMKRYYEATIVINGALEEDGITQTLERVTEFLKRNEVEVKNTEDWGRKRLAYQIEKKTNGHYVRMGFDADSDFVVRLERFFQLEEQILRSLVLQLSERDLRQRSETKEQLAAIAAAIIAAAEAAAAESAPADVPAEVADTADAAETE